MGWWTLSSRSVRPERVVGREVGGHPLDPKFTCSDRCEDISTGHNETPFGFILQFALNLKCLLYTFRISCKAIKNFEKYPVSSQRNVKVLETVTKVKSYFSHQSKHIWSGPLNKLRVQESGEGSEWLWDPHVESSDTSHSWGPRRVPRANSCDQIHNLPTRGGKRGRRVGTVKTPGLLVRAERSAHKSREGITLLSRTLLLSSRVGPSKYINTVSSTLDLGSDPDLFSILCL